MFLRRSRFLHLLPLSDERALAIHAVSHLRLTIDREVQGLLEFFAQPRAVPECLSDLRRLLRHSDDVVIGCLASLHERGFLTERTPEEELADIAAKLGEVHGRDPDTALEQHRRESKAGADPAWAVTQTAGLPDLDPPKQRIELLLFGDCDLQMESDFLRREGARRGVDLRIAATFPDDVRFAGERAHQAIVIGALRSRRDITSADAVHSPFEPYIAEAFSMLESLRTYTSAPILIDNLPEPTVQPLGFADRGENGHRNRFRRANLALEALAEQFADVHVVDVAAALNAAGSERLLDDGLVSFTHFGSPGWMLQRPDSERAAVHGLFPDTAPLAEQVGGSAYGREAVMARVHMDALAVVLGIDRKKCVVVDLDGVLWPGVLAETGSPFAWSPEVSGLYSYFGLYLGIHEALKTLQRRGVLLACVSKNDEATVRELWRYPDHYPHDRLLTPDDFVTWRVNWDDKVGNIASIADELGLALETFVFIDDRQFERDNVIARLPQVEAWGEDLFALRRRLLNDPRLQVPSVTQESSVRTDLVKAQLGRKKLQTQGMDAQTFIASLDLESTVAALSPGVALDRVEELFQRTTQFNTTGRRFAAAELASLLETRSGSVFTLRVRDRFGDHGLVGAAVVVGEEIVGFAMSCRVIGLGVEHSLLDHVLASLAGRLDQVTGRIVETARNARVRNLYLDHGFVAEADGVWRRCLSAADLDTGLKRAG